MGYMFAVHSARALPPNPSVESSACAPLLRLPLPHAVAPAPSGPHLSPSHALLSTRQGASSFNQSPSFDTSSVTNMGWMFAVISPPVLYPQPSSRVLRACAPLAPPRPHAFSASPSPPRTSPRFARPPFDPAVHEHVQRAADLQHVQCHAHGPHGHGPHVLRALRPCPVPPTPPVEPSAAPLAPAAAPHAPPHLPTHTSPRILRPPLNSAENERLVRQQQAGDPLRMGGQSGQLGLHHCWLCRDLGARWLCRALGGFGKLPPLKIGQPSALRPAESVTLRPKSSVRLMEKWSRVYR